MADKKKRFDVIFEGTGTTGPNMRNDIAVEWPCKRYWVVNVPWHGLLVFRIPLHQILTLVIAVPSFLLHFPLHWVHRIPVIPAVKQI